MLPLRASSLPSDCSCCKLASKVERKGFASWKLSVTCGSRWPLCEMKFRRRAPRHANNDGSFCNCGRARVHGRDDQWLTFHSFGRAAAANPANGYPNLSLKCVDVPKAQYVVGIRLQLSSCNNQAEEIFAYDQGTRRLVIGHLCVESWGRGEAADAVGLGACTDAPNQQWRAAASGDYYLFAGMNNGCLAIKAIAKETAPNDTAAKCSHLSMRVPGTDIEFMRGVNDDWVNHFVDGSGKSWTFNWHLLSDNSSELVLYGKIRDRYARFDLFGRKLYGRNGNSGKWEAPREIVRSDC
jgi:hypothetical protein